MSCIFLCYPILASVMPRLPLHSTTGGQMRRQRHAMTANSNRIGSLLKYWKALKNCLPGSSRLLPIPLGFFRFLLLSLRPSVGGRGDTHMERHKNPKENKLKSVSCQCVYPCIPYSLSLELI